MTVLVLGIPSEPPTRLVIEALHRLGHPTVVWNQRRVLDTEVELALGGEGEGKGWLAFGDEGVDVGSLAGIYVRVTGNHTLPEVIGADRSEQAHADRVVDLLLTLCNLTGATVVNRPSAPDGNSSKPYQAQLISRYFAVPETVATNDPDAARAFVARHPRSIYKSTSSERSVVTAVGAADLDRLDRLRACPVQFQERIDGVDLRVHTVGTTTVHGTLIDGTSGDGADYRYGSHSRMSAVEVPDDIAGRCLALAADLELDLAGIDLKLTPDGDVYCFEVNSCPGFSAYEEVTGQPISCAVASLLTGEHGGCGCGC